MKKVFAIALAITALGWLLIGYKSASLIWPINWGLGFATGWACTVCGFYQLKSAIDLTQTTA